MKEPTPGIFVPIGNWQVGTLAEDILQAEDQSQLQTETGQLIEWET